MSGDMGFYFWGGIFGFWFIFADRYLRLGPWQGPQFAFSQFAFPQFVSNTCIIKV